MFGNFFSNVEIVGFGFKLPVGFTLKLFVRFGFKLPVEFEFKLLVGFEFKFSVYTYNSYGCVFNGGKIGEM